MGFAGSSGQFWLAVERTTANVDIDFANDQIVMMPVCPRYIRTTITHGDPPHPSAEGTAR